jgi:hypothetical protein
MDSNMTVVPMTDDETCLIRHHGLTLGQIKWRHDKQR